MQQPYLIEWHDRLQTILRLTFTGRLTAAIFEEASRKCTEIIQTKSHRVDSIVDITDVSSLDVPGLIQVMPRVNAFAASNLHLNVIVGMSPSAKVVTEATAQIAPRIIGNVRAAKDFAEAEDIIHKHRVQLKQAPQLIQPTASPPTRNNAPSANQPPAQLAASPPTRNNTPNINQPPAQPAASPPTRNNTPNINQPSAQPAASPPPRNNAPSANQSPAQPPSRGSVVEDPDKTQPRHWQHGKPSTSSSTR